MNFKFTKSKKFIAINACIVVAIILLIFVKVPYSPTFRTEKTLKGSQQKAKGVLSTGRLAPLPSSAIELKAGGWNSLVTGENLIKFRATPEDIEKFIAQSPSIKDTAPEIFSPEHMHLPMPNDPADRNDFEHDYNHEYYYEYDNPDWYKPTIKIKGRLYNIPGDPKYDGAHNMGEVIIDDETNTVYISVVWS